MNHQVAYYFLGSWDGQVASKTKSKKVYFVKASHNPTTEITTKVTVITPFVFLEEKD